MKTTKNVSSTVGRTTLEEAPNRALLFLRAVGTSPVIRSALSRCGYTAKDHERGWLLVRNLTGPFTQVDVEPQVPVSSALAELGTWIGPGFMRARAALRHIHPNEERFVFDSLQSTSGPGLVVAVATFLDRCDALEKSPERKSSRKADHAALSTLEQRGITKRVRSRLRELVVFIEKNLAPHEEPVMSTSDRTDHLRALHAWVQDWSETARAVIVRRDLLLRMGIGKRRPRKSKSDDRAPSATDAIR